MGLFDVLTGKRKIKQPAADRLFAMSTAGVTLDTELGLKGSGRAAIVFQPLGTADFDQIVKDMEELLRSTGDETGAAIERRDDKFGYRWMILGDPDFEDVVVGINAVSTELQAGGYGDPLLAAVFSFRAPAPRCSPPATPPASPSIGSTTTSGARSTPSSPRAASSSATPSASCACRRRSAPSSPLRRSSIAGSRSGTSRSSGRAGYTARVEATVELRHRPLRGPRWRARLGGCRPLGERQ